MSQYYLTRKDYLVHHGILGQKWGVRRYENEDGTLTPEGKERYSSNTRNEKFKKALKIGAALVGTALVAYGGYKVYKLAGEHADTILKGRLYAQKAKMDTAFRKFDNRSQLAVRMGKAGQDTTQIIKDTNQALSEYNQHKNNYQALDSKFRNSSYIQKLKDANNLIKFNEAHGTSAKDSYKYFKEQIPASELKKKVKSKPLSAAGKEYVNSYLGW